MKLNLKELFDKYEDEFLKFDRVENKRSTYADIHAFLISGPLRNRHEMLMSANSTTGKAL